MHSAGMLAEARVRNLDLVECISRADQIQGCSVAIGSLSWAVRICIGHVIKTMRYGKNHIQKGSSGMARSLKSGLSSLMLSGMHLANATLLLSRSA